MDNFRTKYRNKRYIAHVSILGTTQLHKRNPITLACWSMAFPGFGHLLLNKYLRGYALILWEMFINQKVHLNLALVYTFNGQFQAARDVLDPSFMSLYIPVYLFAIYDSYRTAVDMNKIYLLAQREKGRFNEFTIGALEINYLDKRKPWVAAVWSMGIPSLGQMFLHRIVLAAFILISTIVIIWNSNFILAIHYLILGDVDTSSSVLDKQWLLYFPSYYFFTIYDAYINTIENNKLFDDVQKQYLIENYQPVGHHITIGDK
ncbi:hypothetical protein P5G65_22675 [Paenibacillus chondroitinus]|uniref:Uncharacterized protein n=1 Tax=Paenibacillus chondroitinus TaxID=59842 RepID=A0ABU6DG38_9BACL|nr:MULTISPECIES: hypothetical protein [Paenibacillus]MCY9662657.1 hypothetical protein [Paenibacillus anseongense]MEB4796718.1 hypothetical protein [Paenibacillus chondroitinus]